MHAKSPDSPKIASGKVMRPKLYTTAESLRLDSRFFTRSRALGLCQVFGNVAVFLILLALASTVHSIWQGVLLFVAIGFALHRLFFPVHDCIHYSLFPTKAENSFFGVLLSALLGTSFDAIRIQHMEHHREFATPEDPGASDYFVRFRSRGEFVLFIVGPLVGYTLFTKLRDYLLRPGQSVEIKEESQPGKGPGLMTKLGPYAVIASVQLGICALLTRGFQMHELWRYPVFDVLPLVTIFLFLVRLRMFLEHGSLDYEVCDYFEGKRPTARTIYASWIERILLCGSDFNFHHEHHLYPSVPGRHLPGLHRELEVAGLDAEDVRHTYCQSLAEIWGHLSMPRGDAEVGVAGKS
jgi:fatty acid desaturase